MDPSKSTLRRHKNILGRLNGLADKASKQADKHLIKASKTKGAESKQHLQNHKDARKEAKLFAKAHAKINGMSHRSLGKHDAHSLERHAEHMISGKPHAVKSLKKSKTVKVLSPHPDSLKMKRSIKDREEQLHKKVRVKNTPVKVETKMSRGKKPDVPFGTKKVHGNTGRRHTDVTKAKMSNTHKKRWAKIRRNMLKSKRAKFG